MPASLIAYAWHGLSAALLAGAAAAGGTIQVAKRLPLDWEWALILIAALVAGVNGINSYRTNPK